MHILWLLIMSMLTSCMEDEEFWESDHHDYSIPFNGVYVVNEGNFMYGNASLSFYDIRSGEVINEVFVHTNSLPLGDVACSMTIQDSLGYVVVNNSGKIYIINTRTFEYVGKITGFTSPRYIHFINGTKAYVTDLYARSISIVNPVTRQITGSINVGNNNPDFYQHSTEQMVQYDRYIFINCWSFDDKILVIDSETDQVVDSIQVLKQPNSMVLDRYDALWVLTDGGYEGSPYGFETPGLLKIEAGSREVKEIFRFEPGERPGNLVINGSGDTLYFINRHIYRMGIGAATPPEMLIPSPYGETGSGGFYGLDTDPASSEIYVADAIDHVQRGVVYRFRSDGSPVDTFRVGITPGAFCFKQ